MLRADRRLMRRSDKSGRISVATAGKKGIISDITCGQYKHDHPIVSDCICCQTQASASNLIGMHIGCSFMLLHLQPALGLEELKGSLPQHAVA